ncbi:MAG: DUF3574 domain-containing protein [bacterium]|nr:DUF3574 domain-containing protein [bacterium]MDE0502088.1 DUF3574 domain-containing protein [bacterium]
MSKPGASPFSITRKARLVLVLFVLAGSVVAACSESDDLTCPEGSEAFVRYELFMGRSGPGGEVVTDQAWEAFLGDTVTPRFPDGLTVLDAQGQWSDSEGQILKERSKVLVILAPPGDDPRGLIDEVSDEYKRRFNQESVLEVESDACVSFS